MAKLEEFYVFVMEGPMPGDESIINLQAVNSTGDMLWLPLATHNSSELGRLKELAEGIGGQFRRDIKLLKFTRGEEIIG